MRLYEFCLIFEASKTAAPSGAGDGYELEPLFNLLNINSSETQLLFFQLSQLKTHFHN